MAKIEAERHRLMAAYVVAKAHENSSAFRKVAEAAPMILRLNSFGPGTAMLMRQQSKESSLLAEALAAWLLQTCSWRQIWYDGPPAAKPADLLRWISLADQKQYRAAAREAECFLVALKRFATALCAPMED